MKFWPAIIALCALAACRTNEDPSLFALRSPGETGIHFANALQEDDSINNPLTFDYLYNGAGVAVGDLNNDGRPDLYFAGNEVSSRLYLNGGKLKFDDVTDIAGVGTKVWSTGVTLVDINQDGLLDIYVSVAGLVPEEQRGNLLFVNQGLDKNGTPRFIEQAKQYGIADTGYSTHAVFLDYDRDGDLDLYVLTNGVEEANRNTVRPRLRKGEAPTTDRLYRNNGDRTFTNVSQDAGITMEGHGLGVAVSDLNQDGWPDLYVSNDFVSNDLIWINNQDGTFTNRAGRYLKHQAHNGMGTDVADYNNDGLPDIIAVDMLPPDNLRQKMMFGKSNQDLFQMSLYMGYEPQYVRNSLQLNAGPGPDGEPRFSEIGQLAGVHATDWSWAPLLADFDNDGLKDLFISNGFRRDITNLDFIVYTQETQAMRSPEQRRRKLFGELKKLPEIKLRNYVFRNNGDLTFSDRSKDWGMEDANFSNGAAYADLDGDGDLDLVVNNLDGLASLYENRAERLSGRRFLRVALRGPTGNRGGYGTKLIARYDGRRQYLEHSPYRGYKSTMEGPLHFGLGKARSVDSLEVHWPDGTYQLLTGVAADQVITVDHRAAGPAPSRAPATESLLLRAARASHGLASAHQARTLDDFKSTPLLPRKYSQDGPGLAIGDVDGNGLDDVFIGADRNEPRAIFFQMAPGQFAKRPFPMDSTYQDMGALFFDADGDGDQDLYVVSGGSYPPKSDSRSLYQDRLYLNDGRGLLRHDPTALPAESSSGSSVIAADYDQDGDLDLFVGGRLRPGEYPLPARSLLLRNDSRPGAPRFTNVTASAAPGLEHVGLVTSALWTDFDQDGKTDLLVVGEWMPLTFFRNQGGGRLGNVTASTGLDKSHGWWNSLAAGDFDNDGDMDYLAGNLGLNSRFKASATEPVRVHARDFDENGSVDPVLSYYMGGKSYPVAQRDVMIDQIINMRGRFKRYADYATATLDKTFSKKELKGAYVAESYTMKSSVLENLGNGKFTLRPLPTVAQVAPLYGMVVADRNGDGALDVLAAGNSYAGETNFGWYDGSVGALLLGNGKGGFSDVGFKKSGFFVDGDAKAASEIMIDGTRSLVLITQNNDSLKVFSSVGEGRRNIRLQPLDAYAVLTLADGGTRRQEFYYGSTYLSQSSRFLALPGTATRAVIYNYAGKKRTVGF